MFIDFNPFVCRTCLWSMIRKQGRWPLTTSLWPVFRSRGWLILSEGTTFTRISELYEDCVFVCNEIWIYLSCVFQSRPGDERNCDSCIWGFHGIGHGSPQLETRPEAIHSISGAESLLDETFLVDLQQLGSAQHSANSNKLTWNTMMSFSHSWKWTLFLVIVKSLKFVLCDTPKNTILMHLMRLVWLQTNVRFKCLNWKVFFLSIYLPLDIYSTTLLTRTWQPCCSLNSHDRDSNFQSCNVQTFIVVHKCPDFQYCTVFTSDIPCAKIRMNWFVDNKALWENESFYWLQFMSFRNGCFK